MKKYQENTRDTKDFDFGEVDLTFSSTTLVFLTSIGAFLYHLIYSYWPYIKRKKKGFKGHYKGNFSLFFYFKLSFKEYTPVCFFKSVCFGFELGLNNYFKLI